MTILNFKNIQYFENIDKVDINNTPIKTRVNTNNSLRN